MLKHDNYNQHQARRPKTKAITEPTINKDPLALYPLIQDDLSTAHSDLRVAIH